MSEFNLLDLLPLVALIAISYIGKRKKGFNTELIKKLRAQHPDGTYFYCTAVEDIGDNRIQFHGDLHGGDIRPGMKIIISEIGEYELKEVYAADKNPDKPDEMIINNSQDVAILIESRDINLDKLKRKIKQGKVIALSIKE